MVYGTDEFNYTLRLDKDEKLVENLLSFVRTNQIRGAWVFALGGLKEAELGMYDLEAKRYNFTNIAGPLELVSLTGTVAWQDNEPALHLHASVSDKTLAVCGGHLKEAVVSGTVEVFIHVWDTDKGFERQHDEQSGLNLLQP